MAKYGNLKLVVTIVREEYADEVFNKYKENGIEGWTVTKARGASKESQDKILGMPIEPQKEIIFTVVEDKDTDHALELAEKAGNLSDEGNGLSCVVDVEKAIGILASKPITTS
ncbi:P-II family nitrogen regulator [Bacillus sp. FJAT-44742]|uniref:P-II family nitrogen regulator n=1 Tax=Bacillus sp. FJAT-44742 TaxID=2014005 RepID=UPI000C23735A|nr:P-II family nitrogen regulator [Bacillus sp. FJAT-44742]